MATLQSRLAEAGKLSTWNAYNAGQISKAAAEAALGGGMGTVGVSTAGVDFAKKAAEQQRKLLAGQRVEEAGLLGQFETAIAGQEKLPAMYKRIGAEAGIPQQQQVVGGLRNEILRIEGLLEALPEDVKSRVKGTWTTEAMRRRLEATETAPLTRGLSTVARAQEKATGALGEMTGAVGTQMGLETAQMQKELLPIQQKLSAFSDRAAREATGYSAANQMELDAILTKISQQQQLTMAEQARAHDLATMEREFEMEKESLSTSVVTAGGRVKLINDKTGATIADLGASKTGAGTKGERETEANKESLKSAVQAGATVESAVNLYADKLSLSDIKDVYNESTIYGKAKETGAQWREEYRKAQQKMGVIPGLDDDDLF